MAVNESEEIRILLRAGVSVSEIHAMFGCTRKKITNILWRLDNADYMKNVRPGYNARKMREYRAKDPNGNYRAAIERDLKKKKARYHSDPEYRAKMIRRSTEWLRRKRLEPAVEKIGVNHD